MRIQAMVQKKGARTRKGRGFSRGELIEAELDFQRALKLRIPIDKRRKTKHKENVKALKQCLQKQS